MRVQISAEPLLAQPSAGVHRNPAAVSIAIVAPRSLPVSGQPNPSGAGLASARAARRADPATAPPSPPLSRGCWHPTRRCAPRSPPTGAMRPRRSRTPSGRAHRPRPQGDPARTAVHGFPATMPAMRRRTAPDRLRHRGRVGGTDTDASGRASQAPSDRSGPRTAAWDDIPAPLPDWDALAQPASHPQTAQLSQEPLARCPEHA